MDWFGTYLTRTLFQDANCAQDQEHIQNSSKMESIVKIVNGFQSFIIFAKGIILEIFGNYECVSEGPF